MDSLQISDKEALKRLQPAVKRKKKRRFKPHWVKLPARWVEILRQSRSVGTYQLALVILIEAFKREQVGGELVLSSQITGMSRSTRARAIDELVRLGLIRIERDGKRAIRVINIRIR
jgi:Fic family protein